MFEISPVYTSHRSLKRKFVIDGDMRQSEIRCVVNSAVLYAADLVEGNIPFVVRENDNVTSGKSWLAKHV